MPSLPCRLTSILLSRLILDLHAYPIHGGARISGILSTIQFVENEDEKVEAPEQTISNASLVLVESGTTVRPAQASDETLQEY